MPYCRIAGPIEEVVIVYCIVAEGCYHKLVKKGKLCLRALLHQFKIQSRF